MTLYADRTTNQPVPFHRLRKKDFAGPLQAGVLTATDFKVAQRSAGINMSVDVVHGDCWVQTDVDTPDGLVHVYSDADGNFAVAASHATLPRVDTVLVQYNDTSVGAGVGGDTPTIRVLTGTATTGAQITSPTGANYRAGAAVTNPNDGEVVGDILVRAATTSILNTDIVDRRKWARGAYSRIVRNSNAGAGNDYTTTSGTVVDVDATNLKPRIECSGAPLRISLRGRGIGATASTVLYLGIDGATIDGGAAILLPNASTPVMFTWDAVPAAGSHLVGPMWNSVTAGQVSTLNAQAGLPLQLTVEEIVRQSASNT
jgi:hypothetical protein